MGQAYDQVIRRYIEDAVAAEQSAEAQMRSFERDTADDEEVKALFALAAEQARQNAERWTAMLDKNASGAKAALADTLSSMPRVAQTGHIQEERVVQNLIAAYTIQMGKCAMYQGLFEAATRAAMEPVVQTAAIAGEASEQSAKKLFHLIPTRSIIAYNMLTVTEVDPSVETKYRESSWST